MSISPRWEHKLADSQDQYNYRPGAHQGEACDLSCVVQVLHKLADKPAVVGTASPSIDQYQLKQVIDPAVNMIVQAICNLQSVGIALHRKDSERHVSFATSRGVQYIVDPTKVSRMAYHKGGMDWVGNVQPDQDSELVFDVAYTDQSAHRFFGTDADAIYLTLTQAIGPRVVPSGWGNG